ncbi:hypothetical protein [Streptomyces zaehneri]|uniref:hypothetical protein n=1 Tax=Streptomyces zaehneri TaxID=3051180 RepID=UPI0028D0B478|nr:hypothetical protein [Streptomyces sp. DSM 40713]
MTVRTAWLTETGQTREDTRITLSGLLTPNALVAENIPLKARGGIVPGGFALSGGTGGMTLTIGTGRAFVQGGRPHQGTYAVAVTEPEILTIEDGDPTHQRIDLVELVVQDSTYDGTADTVARVRLVKGTPAATPQQPAGPDGSALPLYRILVPAGASAGSGGLAWDTAVTNLRYATVALGGIVPAAGFSGAYAGQYRDNAGVLERWDGTAWVAYPKGVGGIPPAGTLTAGSYAGQYQEDPTGPLQRWNGSAWVAYPKSVGGIAPSGTVATGGYPGQYREDSAGLLQRWDGSAWSYAEGRTTLLLSVSQTIEQSVVPNTWTQMTLQSTDVDDAAGWSGSNTYTVPRAGWWRVSGSVTWLQQPSTASRGARIYLNGSGVARATWLIGAGPGATSVGGSALIRCAAGDKLALYGLQSSSVTINTLGGSGYYTNLTAEWLKS